MLKSTVRALQSMLDRQRILTLAVQTGQGPHAGILIHEQDGPDQDPLQIERLMFDCTVQPFERKSAEWAAGRELYLARFPDSRVTFGLGDFTLYRLQFVAGTYVAGFGRAMDIEPQDIRRLAESA